MKNVAIYARRAELIERDAWLDFFDAASNEVRGKFGLANERIGSIGLLASPVVPISEFNRAMAVGVGGTSIDEFTRAVVWLDEHAGASWALQIAPPTPSEFDEPIRRHGLRPSGAGWAKFVRDPSTRHHPDLSRAASVTQAEHATAAIFGQTVQDGFGLPDGSSAWFASLVGRAGWNCFLATIDGKPAGAAAMFSSAQAAWAGMSTTLPDVRGRGVQSSLIAARQTVAEERGITVLTCETEYPTGGNEREFSSYRNQKRMGFTEIYVRPNLKRQA